MQLNMKSIEKINHTKFSPAGISICSSQVSNQCIERFLLHRSIRIRHSLSKKRTYKIQMKKKKTHKHISDSASRSKSKCTTTTTTSTETSNQIHHPEIKTKSENTKTLKIQKKKKYRPNSRMRESLGSEMESQREAKSTLASLRTFQFLWKRRSSHGSFLASFNNFSSSDDIAGGVATIYRIFARRNPIDLLECAADCRERNKREREGESVVVFFCLVQCRREREKKMEKKWRERGNGFFIFASEIHLRREGGFFFVFLDPRAGVRSVERKRRF